MVKKLLVVLVLALLSIQAIADPPDKAKSPVERLAEKVRDSVVQISFTGRNGKTQGLGTGFVLSSDGLIATNYHVLGEARPIFVELADKSKLDVKSIHASDRNMDLAIVKVDAKDLPVLKLGDSDRARQGQSIVVMGNPHGLKHSVVSGVLSNRRELEGRKMLQIAMPIEKGNSGGPVLDMDGNVLGVVTMKSAITENLGFAVEINHLKSLIEKPNPIPMNRWLTIGVLDKREWTPMFGARWRQQAGRIVASGDGDDPIGRRSICVSHLKLPERPFELAVDVRLDDESGAAGLIFHSDGGEKHYGFYPSKGRLRLSRFEGPTVFTWKVLSEQPTEHYRPGEWNRLKVRVEKEKMLCYVNGHLVIESTDNGLRDGKVGLAKFRSTKADFKNFQLAKQIASTSISEEARTKLNKLIDKLPDLSTIDDSQLVPLAETPRTSSSVLRDRAAKLQQRAKEFRRMAADIHLYGIAGELAREMKDEEKADLLRATLLIARLDDEELIVEPYIKQVDRMVNEIKSELAKNATETERIAALDKYLFAENGFHGSRTNYYHQANSYMSSVLDDREGLPITLSVLYMELGRRLGLRIEGVGLPGHFVVKHTPKEGELQLIDVFHEAKPMSRKEAGALVQGAYDRELNEDDLRAATKTEIILRMLTNLRGIAMQARDDEAVLRYLSAAISVEPELIQERFQRAEVRFRTGRRSAGLADLDWIIAKEPEGVDMEGLRQVRERMRTRE